MDKNIIHLMMIFVFIISIDGCTNRQDNFVHTVFQTNGATSMVRYNKILNNLLLELSKKLIKRNRELFSKDIVLYLKNEMANKKNDISLPMVKDVKNDNYGKYLKVAFSKKRVKHQGDYLLVGLYKMFYWSFEGANYKISALQYDGKKLQKAYNVLQAIAWKIKVARDEKENYIYLTWQNNWQVELENRMKKGEKLSGKLLNSLKYIKNKKESLLSPSNLSFEKLFGKMQLVYEMSLKTVGVEPKSLGADAIRGIFLML